MRKRVGSRGRSSRAWGRLERHPVAHAESALLRAPIVRCFVRTKGLIAYEALHQHGLELLEASLPFCFGVLVRCDLVRRGDVDRSAFEDNLEAFAVVGMLEFLLDEIINVSSMSLDLIPLPEVRSPP